MLNLIYFSGDRTYSQDDIIMHPCFARKKREVSNIVGVFRRNSHAHLALCGREKKKKAKMLAKTKKTIQIKIQ